MYDRVLLKKIEPETKTAGGLVLPNAVDPIPEATVIKVGSGRITEEGLTIPVSVKEGDRVIYNPNATISLTVNKEAYIMVDEKEIIAIVDQD